MDKHLFDNELKLSTCITNLHANKKKAFGSIIVYVFFLYDVAILLC